MLSIGRLGLKFARRFKGCIHLKSMRCFFFSSSRLFIMGALALLSLTACASSIPSNFVYETSLRNEQGFIGAANRKGSAEALLNGGVVIDPNTSLQAALPMAQVKVRRWGLVYLSKNWKRYQAVLDADVTRDGKIIKCRMMSPDTLSGAPTLPEMRANDGTELQRRLSDLVKACAAQR